jgi:hypothetical protein
LYAPYEPVDGKRLIIADVADVEEKAENYSDYQLACVDAVRSSGGSVWHDERGIVDEHGNEDM